MNVSRETKDKLVEYVSLVEKWNPRINLVSKTTVPQIWERHIRDSAQIFDLAPNFQHWVDLGSGGGFPGIVVAILAQDSNAAGNVTLVESDQRKCEFLRHVGRALLLRIKVITTRIEKAEPLGADILSARALAPLPELLEFSERHRRKDGISFFPKGRGYMTELEKSKESWNLGYTAHASLTDPESVILEIKGMDRVAN